MRGQKVSVSDNKRGREDSRRPAKEDEEEYRPKTFG
jgi:hypothetical protein